MSDKDNISSGGDDGSVKIGSPADGRSDQSGRRQQWGRRLLGWILGTLGVIAVLPVLILLALLLALLGLAVPTGIVVLIAAVLLFAFLAILFKLLSGGMKRLFGVWSIAVAVLLGFVIGAILATKKPALGQKITHWFDRSWQVPMATGENEKK